jgi:Kef-type K+ transport system membrane component KefB
MNTHVHHTELLLFFVLLQLIIIIAAGRIGSTLAVRVGQNAAVGEIVVGLLLGPSFYGALAPETFQYVFRSVSSESLTILSQIGLLLLMFQIGLEFDFGHLSNLRNRRSVIAVSIAGLLVPFLTGLVVGYLTAPWLSPKADHITSSLFIATALSITALPILGRILLDLSLEHTSLGVIAICAAAINDVFGWVLLMLVTALAAAQFSGAIFAVNLLLIVGFFVVSQWCVRPVLLCLLRWLRLQSGEPLDSATLGVLLISIFAAGITTYKLGIFAIFGGFMAGVILSRERELVQTWRERITPFVTVFFLPIFFTFTGLRTNIGGLDSVVLWIACAGIIALACLAKYLPVYWAACAVGHPKEEAKMLGILMNTRALMELIVINIGYELGAISQNMFTILVLMAIVSTVITSPLMRRWLRVHPITT